MYFLFKKKNKTFLIGLIYFIIWEKNVFNPSYETILAASLNSSTRILHPYPVGAAVMYVSSFYMYFNYSQVSFCIWKVHNVF